MSRSLPGSVPQPEPAAGRSVYPRVAREAGLTVAGGFPNVPNNAIKHHQQHAEPARGRAQPPVNFDCQS